MTINVLPIAMSATAALGCNKQFEFYEYLSNEINEIGNEVPVYAESVLYTGSIQPVSNKMYEQLGLDLDKHYKVVYCPQLVQSLAEKDIPDRVKYEGKIYDVIENKNWWETNGYTKFLMCEVKAERENGTNS